MYEIFVKIMVFFVFVRGRIRFNIVVLASFSIKKNNDLEIIRKIK